MKYLHLFFACFMICVPAHAQKQLWGMAASKGAVKGTIFKTDSTGDNYTDVYTFSDPAQGIDPYGSLMLATNGKLYGMTSAGGSNNYGVVFEIDPATGIYTKKHDFDSVNGMKPYGSLVQAANGKLYGMTYGGGTAVFSKSRGVLFEYDITTGSFTGKVDLLVFNISWPYGTLTKGSDGMLYGLASVGGADATGILFKYNITTATTTHISSFISGPPWYGMAPRGAVVELPDGTFYGFSRNGGAGTAGGGVIFRYDPADPVWANTESRHKLSELDPDSLNGYELMSTPVYATDGKLYGMTHKGGAGGAGTIFSYDPVVDTYLKRYDFNEATEGFAPYGSLMQASDGWLYGLITSEGGQARLFRFNSVTGTFQLKADVTGTPFYTALTEVQLLPTDVRDVHADDKVRVYPTPSLSKISIDLPKGFEWSHMAITSISGNVVYAHEGSVQNIDVSALPGGVYTLTISADGKVLRGTFVKE